mmetsp:Transcript_14936/g.39440  ORF Transcript_14936/g.39440 Transcript_14936/m.39440 type:complete len:221 (-) Transcript_14936:260-922(-)
MSRGSPNNWTRRSHLLLLLLVPRRCKTPCTATTPGSPRPPRSTPCSPTPSPAARATRCPHGPPRLSRPNLLWLLPKNRHHDGCQSRGCCPCRCRCCRQSEPQPQKMPLHTSSLPSNPTARPARWKHRWVTAPFVFRPEADRGLRCSWPSPRLKLQPELARGGRQGRCPARPRCAGKAKFVRPRRERTQSPQAGRCRPEPKARPQPASPCPSSPRSRCPQH